MVLDVTASGDANRMMELMAEEEPFAVQVNDVLKYIRDHCQMSQSSRYDHGSVAKAQQ